MTRTIAHRPGWLPVCSLATVALLVLGAAGDPPDAPCRVEIDVEPPVAYVGEQVVHRIRIARKPEVRRVLWHRAPGFPDHRMEPLASPEEIARPSTDGVLWRVREERRALFAARAGRLELPAAVLHCVTGDPGDETVHELTIDPIEVEARPLPTPPGTSGLVGPVQWRRSVDRRRVALGESVRVTLYASGPGDVWRLSLDLPAADDDAPVAFDVFAAGEHTDAAREERLVTRRTARFDVVPRRTGRLVLPAQSVVWIDPATGSPRTRTAPPIEIEVTAPDVRASAPKADDGHRTAQAVGTDGAPPAHEARAADGDRPRAPIGVTLLAAITLAALSFGAGWLLYRVRPARRAVQDALRAAEAAARAGDRRREAEALERALRATLALRSPALAGLLPPELAWRGADDERLTRAATLLADLDEVRFGATPRMPDRDAVRAWIAETLR